MSFANSEALQRAVFAHLTADPGVTAILGDGVHDALPVGDLPEVYLTLGPEDVRDRSTQTGGMAEHRLSLSIVSLAAGFSTAKAAAGAVTEALVDADLTLERGRLVALRFMRARAVRTRAAEGRRIDLTFRAIVEDD